MLAHVCTTESLRAGIDSPPMECPYCGKKTLLILWPSLNCTTCGYDSEYRNPIKTMREITGLSRKDIALRTGLKASTIKKYEWCETSEKYLKWFKCFIREWYK